MVSLKKKHYDGRLQERTGQIRARRTGTKQDNRGEQIREAAEGEIREGGQTGCSRAARMKKNNSRNNNRKT